MSDIQIRQHFSCSRDELFAYWTHPKLIETWFFPKPLWTCDAHIDFRDGGNYQLRLTNDDGIIHTFSGHYLEIKPGHYVSMTWSSPIVQQSIVTLLMESNDNGTWFTLKHIGLESTDIIQFNLAGWEGVLDHLTWVSGR